MAGVLTKKPLKLYKTEYRFDSYVSSESCFTTHILARSFEEAERFAKLRGMGEQVLCEIGFPKTKHGPVYRRFEGVKKLSRLEQLKMMHELMFLLQLGIAASVVTWKEAFMWDRSLLHEALHFALTNDDLPSTLPHLKKSFKRIETGIPGYYPAKGL